VIVDPAEAAHAFRRATDLCSKLAADFPFVPEYQGNLAMSQGNLGSALKKTGHHAEAEQAYRRTIALLEKLMAESPSLTRYRNDLALGYANLGNLLTATGRQVEAEKAYQQAVTLQEKLAADAPSVLEFRGELAWSHTTLGNLLAKTGRPAESEQAYRRAIALFEKLVSESPSVTDYQSGLASSSAHLAILLQAAGRISQEDYLQAMGSAEKWADPEAQNELAWSLATRPNSALSDRQLALRLAKRAVELAPQSGDYWNTLGLAHYRAGGWKAAIEAVEKSIQLRAGGHPSDWVFLALAWWQKGDRDKARSWYDKAVQGMEQNKSQDEDLRRFRDEAAALLGETDHPKSTGNKEKNTQQRSRP
jgi:tetratricopeptide (TPR) repeat protein